jgi:predicted secreted Zn-dependent protease
LADKAARLALALSLGATAATAAVDTREQYTPYVVHGRSLQALQSDLAQRGPRDPATGVRYSGRTDYDVKWTYRYRTSGTGCAIDELNVRMVITFILPRWVDEYTASPAMRTTWTRYISNLTTHEQGHAALYRQTGPAVEAAIRALPAAPTCDAMGQRANAAANQVLRTTDATSARYDQTTQHGATQGAWLE